MAKRKNNRKVVKIKKIVERPFNAGTQTKAAFFGMLKNALRRLSMYWKPISLCKLNARRAYKGPNKRRKWEYQCAKCKNYFPGEKVSVDHIMPVGTLSSFEDIEGVVRRLFVEVDQLQCLCSTCHNEKSLNENNERRNNKLQGEV